MRNSKWGDKKSCGDSDILRLTCYPDILIYIIVSHKPFSL